MEVPKFEAEENKALVIESLMGESRTLERGETLEIKVAKGCSFFVREGASLKIAESVGNSIMLEGGANLVIESGQANSIGAATKPPSLIETKEEQVQTSAESGEIEQDVTEKQEEVKNPPSGETSFEFGGRQIGYSLKSVAGETIHDKNKIGDALRAGFDHIKVNPWTGRELPEEIKKEILKRSLNEFSDERGNGLSAEEKVEWSKFVDNLSS